MSSIKYTSALIAAVLLLFALNLSAASASSVNLPESGNYEMGDEFDEPPVKARVARVSFMSGDIQIRRSGVDSWERLATNLPIVEGDEIATGPAARAEIQFDSNTHLRLGENSFVRIIKLADDGIALSLPEGSAIARLTQYDASRSYFEMDAPGTTFAFQRNGVYRIDAGSRDSGEVAVGAAEGGEVRVYTETAGFTLKNGRRARIFVAGRNSGEWETGDVARFADEFDSWSLERDAVIARSLQRAYYDRYYDRDIYGADDLTDNGEWIYTRKYGYVWRPYSSAVSRYANWSPYRYGHWRWVPAFGWTWVNDEPWGWATYHYGRWIWDNGGWVWTPYGYYRYSRSWWSPALVVMTIYNSNICWYPLPYSYAYYNYNYYYYNHGGWGGHGPGGNGGGNGGGGPHPTPTPTPPAGGGPVAVNGPGLNKNKRPPLEEVPPTGVVTVDRSQFGRELGGVKSPPLGDATAILTKVPDARQTPPILPSITDLDGRVDRSIRPDRQPPILPSETIKTGAAVRQSNAPLDRELRTDRITGGRPPLTNEPIVRTDDGTTTRSTGAVDRQPPVRQNTDDRSGPRPRYDQPQQGDGAVKEPPVRTPPRYIPPASDQTQRGNDAPVRQPPVRETPRSDPPPVRQPPRYEPPVRETPRNDPPPVKQPPTSEPPPVKQSPPAKSEDSKPAQPANVDRKKDGR